MSSVLITIVISAVFAGVILFLVERIKKLKNENVASKALINKLQSEKSINNKINEVKHENKKDADEKISSIDYSDVDTALSILHDNSKDD